MRSHLTAVVLASALSSACAKQIVSQPPLPPVNWQSLESQPRAPRAAETTPTDRERAVPGLYTKALASPGFAELGPVLAEEAHFQFAGSRDVRGRENVVRAHDALLGKIQERSIATSRILLTDNSQSLEWTMAGVHEGRPVTIHGLTLLWTKDDGSISDIHLYFDEAMVGAQVEDDPRPLQASAPARSPQEFEQRRSPEESANVSVVRAGLQALTDDDEAAYLATMTSDVEVTTLESAESVRGIAAARAWFRTMHKAIAYLSTSLENAWGIGPLVVVEYHLVGEQRGRIGSIAPQPDKLINLSVVDVVEMRGGKAARVWRYDDPMQLAYSP
jgi:ketosteroid isomerase-like protein